MPDISTINTVAVADIDKFQSITFAHGQKVNNQDVSLVLDAHVLICEEIVSNVTSVTITAGITSTYDVYIFEFINIHPDTESTSAPPSGSGFGFQVDVGTATSYAQSMQSMTIAATHSEDDSVAQMGIFGAWNAAPTYGQNEETALQWMTQQVNSDADSGVSGSLRLYGPSSSTHVKHFISRTASMNTSEEIDDFFVDGHIFTTSPVTRIKFAFDNGSDFDGTIRMYGMTKTVV